MELENIQINQGDADKELQISLSFEKAYKEQCKRIFDAIAEKNTLTNNRVAYPIENEGVNYLLLKGVGYATDRRWEAEKEREVNLYFLLLEDRILYKTNFSGSPNNKIVGDMISNTEIDNLKRNMFAKGFSGALHVYKGDTDGGINSLQTAIDNSLRYAVPNPPVSPVILQGIRI